VSRYVVSFSSGGSILRQHKPAGAGSEVHAAQCGPAVLGDTSVYSGSKANIGTQHITTMAGCCQFLVIINKSALIDLHSCRSAKLISTLKHQTVWFLNYTSDDST